MNSYPKICFLIPYFGKWPRWIDYYLLSCKSNSSLDWHFFTDCGIPSNKPENVYIHEMNIGEFNDLASQNLRIQLNIKHPYKICDLKPAYAIIFQKYVENYDYWSYGDIDVIYGNIRSFLTPELLNDFNILSNHSNFVAGHFCTLSNNVKINSLYKIGGNYKAAFQHPKYVGFDERLSIIKIDPDPKYLNLNKNLNYSSHIILNKIVKNKIIKGLRPIKNLFLKPSRRQKGDFSSIVKAMAAKGELNVRFKTTFESDLMLKKVGVNNWEIKWENGILINSHTQKELLYFHFLLSKNTKRFLVEKLNPNVNRFIIDKTGIKEFI